MPSFQAPRVTSADALERLKKLGPWFYEFDLGEYGRTESELPVEVATRTPEPAGHGRTCG